MQIGDSRECGASCIGDVGPLHVGAGTGSSASILAYALAPIGAHNSAGLRKRWVGVSISSVCAPQQGGKGRSRDSQCSPWKEGVGLVCF